MLSRLTDLYHYLYKCNFCVLTFFLITDIRRWQSYIEPGDEVDTGSPTKRISRNLSELHNDIDPDELLPLAEGTLSRNLGKVYVLYIRFENLGLI